MFANVPNLVQFFCSRLVNPISKKGKLKCPCQSQELPFDKHWTNCSVLLDKVQAKTEIEFPIKPLLRTLTHLS